MCFLQLIAVSQHVVCTHKDIVPRIDPAIPYEARSCAGVMHAQGTSVWHVDRHYAAENVDQIAWAQHKNTNCHLFILLTSF